MKEVVTLNRDYYPPENPPRGTVIWKYEERPDLGENAYYGYHVYTGEKYVPIGDWDKDRGWYSLEDVPDEVVLSEARDALDWF